MSNDKLLAFQLQLSALDALELAWVYFTPEFEAQFLSRRAAQALYITNRHEIGQYQSVLAPLASLAEILSKKRPDASWLEGTRHFEGVNIAELTLETADARSIPVLAFAKTFLVRVATEEGTGVPGYIVVFHDLSILEPFFKTIEQSRRLRTLLVLTASVLGRPIDFESVKDGSDKAIRSAEAEFFRMLPNAFDAVAQADLMTSVRLAIDIVDPLLVPTAKVLVDVRTSAILSISRPNFLRIMCHLLLEAADFVGPFGTTCVRGTLLPIGDADSGTEEHVAEILLRAERKTDIPLNASPLELYIYRRYMPLHYKVGMQERDERRTQGMIAASTASSTGQPASPQTARWSLHVGTNTVVPMDALTPNVRMAAYIAKLCDISLELRRVNIDVMEIIARIPMEGKQIGR